jgi:hypothetical protein
MLAGWRESVGVQAEIGIARASGQQVRFLGVAEAHGSLTVAPGGPEVAR